MDAIVDVGKVTLETERLILRAWQTDDLDNFFEYASVPGVGEMAGWSHHETKRESAAILKMFIEHKKTFALVLKENQKVIGSLGLESLRDYTGEELNDLIGREIGYVLSKEYWGKGLMTEAVKRVIRWCFEEENYDFLLCGNFVENRQSARVQEKTGFQPYKQIKYISASQGPKITQLRLLMNPKEGETR